MKLWPYILLLLPFSSFAIQEQVEILRVVDGDTVLVDRDGKNTRLRVIGIDTPEIVAKDRPVGCFGSEARDYAKELLPVGSQLTLVHENELDKYDRLLTYITLSNGQDFGEVMISNGYAYAYRSFGHERKTRYITSEAQARFNQSGLWAPEACRSDTQAVEQTTKAWQGYISFIEQIFTIIQSILNLFK